MRFSSTLILVAVVAFSGSSLRADTEQSLEQVDALFENYFAWFGSMYHRQSGGAYYSFEARSKPQSYPPHIESTSKYSRVIEWSELVGNVPPSERDAIVDYIKSAQVGDAGSPNYGYFIVPGYTFNDKQTSRALSFSTGILDLFGATPEYPIPGEETGTLPPQVASAAAFIAWLDGRDWNRTWTSGSDLLTQTVYLNQLDATLRQEILDATWDYLANVRQDPATGLWGNLDQGDNRQPYIALNGAHKIVSFFETYGQPVPYAEELMDTALATVETKIAINLLYTYNSSQLAYNLTSLGATISPQETADFIEKQADYLAGFVQTDGGFAPGLSGGSNNTYFQPAVSGPTSETDVGGLALKARDRLHDLAYGTHMPLPNAGDPRLFGMSGANSCVLVRYEFPQKSLAAEVEEEASVTASAFQASGTVATGGPAGDGFWADTGPAGDYEMAHSGFDDQASYYEFTVTPGARPLELYFLAFTARHGGSSGDEAVVVKYRIGNGGSFLNAGRTTIPGSAKGFETRDIPLLIFQDLKHLEQPVTFRIYGENFNTTGRTFRLDTVELFGVPLAISFNDWIGSQGLTGNDALPEAAPRNDGVSNFLKYAFNIPLNAGTPGMVVAGTGTSGLPSISLVFDEGLATFRFEFLRRIHSDLVYLPKTSSSLESNSWTEVSGPAQVIPIDLSWERVIYEKLVEQESEFRIFGRVDTIAK